MMRRPVAPESTNAPSNFQYHLLQDNMHHSGLSCTECLGNQADINTVAAHKASPQIALKSYPRPPHLTLKGNPSCMKNVRITASVS